jgi:molybdopterin-guanine dinucleotide biosynthesis protein A
VTSAVKAPLGLVLTGGKSSRMGRAKAHLNFEGVPQWQRAKQALLGICEQVYFSTSPQLHPPLPLARDSLIDDIFINPYGPVGAVISAFKMYSDRALFVLACDMPFFTHEAASYLLLHRQSNKNATVYKNNLGQIEPLCGIYEPAIFDHLLLGFGRNILCMRKLLSALDVATIDTPNEQWISNINHQKELDAIVCKENFTKSVTVHYYASLRQQAACGSQIVKTRAGNIAELFMELSKQHGFLIGYQKIRFAKNDQLVKPEEEFGEGDNVAFLPPVSGG